MGLLSIYLCFQVFLGPSVTDSGYVVPRFCLYKCFLRGWEDVKSNRMKVKKLVFDGQELAMLFQVFAKKCLLGIVKGICIVLIFYLNQSYKQ